uniref:CHK kinase-like domain-containing protein n=1 Tax=Graphocephala atropunctata TaxID=36148 RepID=A0A1B6LV61_9HEMI
MGPETPPWLNEVYLAVILQGGEDKDPKVTINNFSVKPALSEDENYGSASNVSRVTVEYTFSESTEKHTTSLFIKSPLTKGFLKEYAEKIDLFNREQQFYDVILSQLTDKAQFEFGSRAFYCPDRDRLILQDLKAEGYVMASRAKQLDFSHYELVMASIGKYHASSISLHHENSNLVEKTGAEGLYNDGPFKKEVKGWVETSLKLVSDVLKEIEGYEHYEDLMLSKIDGIWEYLLKEFKPRKNALNVLNHGDLWVNNMMFKYGIQELPMP